MAIRTGRKQTLRQEKLRERRKKPGLQLERLEDRQLLAGLTLAGILPNDGVLMQNGDVRNVAPQDITLRFDQDVDPATLDAIQLIRAGGDDAFAAATISSDFNTVGAVQMRFDANTAGDAGNGITLIVSTANLSPSSRTPDLSVNGNTIFVELNSNPSALTRAFDLRDSMNANPEVSELLTASITDGNAFTPIGNRAVNYSPLTLTGANTSRANVNFNKVGLDIEFRSVATGNAGNGIVINFSINNLGGAAPPQITVNDRVVNIVINNNFGNETTALDLVTAINNNANVSSLIRANINSGNPLTVIGNTTPPPPVLLTGANDVPIIPGFVGLGTVPSEVVVRFAEALPDDSYLLSIRGTGANPLRTAAGMPLNMGVSDESLSFELDLGAQIVSVVPQPIRRLNNNTLVQDRDKILVYFNDDDLNRESAETSSFYQLMLSNNTVTNTDDDVFTPTSVVYSADQDMATLTFAGPIETLAPGGAGGEWRLRIGTDEGSPLAPNRLTPATDAADNFAGALDLNGSFDTGSALVVRGGGDQFEDGQTFSITDADGTTVTFEFEDLSGQVIDGVEDGNVALQFVNDLTQPQMTSQIRDVILSASASGLDVTVTADLANNHLFIGGDTNITLSPQLSALARATQGIIISGTIDNTGQAYAFDLPGGIDDIGHRDIPVESHINQGADILSGITTAAYNFQDAYGFDPQGNILHNTITEIQKDRAREIYQIYGDLLGIQFIETPTSGMTIVTGDMSPLMQVNDVGGVLGVAGGGLTGLAIMDLQDFDDTTDDQFGSGWFRTAFHEIGHLLGMGHTYDLPDPTIQGSDPSQNPVAAEEIFPADGDIVHGRHLYRPESKDIDLFKFTVNDSGVLTAETFAERMANTSLLDTVLNLYRETPDGGYELVARNDDFNSEDSLLEVEVTPGTYFVGVSASGNNIYDPEVADSGFGGVTQGDYELRLNFRGLGDLNRIVDADLGPTALDGDADGVAGGAYNFWFKTQTEANTLIVDKAASATNPNLFRNIDDAVAASSPGDIIRIVGNAGADGDLATVEDNLAYEIGFSALNGVPLADGTALEIPKDVTVMVDSNAILKLRRGRIGVGSSDAVVDRSGAALQVLGVPRLLDNAGNVRLDGLGNVIPGSVYFTSIHDDSIGIDTDPNSDPPDALKGDWGGIIFRRRVDVSNASRLDYERQGVFLNYINHADIQYGGGEVVIDATSRAVSPIEMDESRATISFNTIHDNAGSAIAATPNTFEETNFHTSEFQISDEFTSDYTRVGPDIDNNTIVDNSLNGLEIRVKTPAGVGTLPLTVQARFDDFSITHVLEENLHIEASPGGPLSETVTPATALVTSTNNPLTTGTPLPDGEYRHRIVFVDSAGNEGPPSDPTSPTTVDSATQDVQSITLSNLPPANGFAARRIYRSIDGGAYVLVAQINSFSPTFVDDGTTLGGGLAEFAPELRARLDARLAVDPKVILKISDSIIDVGVGANLIAEGRDGEEVVFTSIHDQRYGTGGTFNTNADPQNLAVPGNWGGIFGWHQSTISLENAVVAYGGGTSRQDGGFRGFGAIEAHQSTFRLANSIVELSDDGTGAIADNRFGRGTNGPSAVFVRGDEPIIVNNIFRNNNAEAMSIDVNSLSADLVEDWGGSRGKADAFNDALGNHGALVRGNLLTNNEINGLVVRGGTLTTEGVWDDTDIVHVVFDQITIPNLHTYGGLRLESSTTESLVVKSFGDNAGFVAAGQQLDIDDRIGGALHVIGQPGRPVVLTSLSDYSVGAGFTPDGQPQTNTANANLDPISNTGLPTIGEVDNGLLIDNDVPQNTPGFFSVEPREGGAIDFFTAGGVTVLGTSGLQVNQDFIFEFLNYVDVGSDGSGIDLSTTTITTPPTLVSDDLVISEGNFTGENGQVNWRVETTLLDGVSRVDNRLILSVNDPQQSLGDLRFISYLDEDVYGISDDFLFTTGTPGEADFRAFTLDDTERVGFSHGGAYLAGGDLVNASYDGWAADEYSELQTAITGAGTTYSVPGNIDTTSLLPFTDPELGPAFGLEDVTTAFAWSVDPTATTATIVSFLELVPADPSREPPLGNPGDWQGIELESFSHDRNVDMINEREAQDAITGSNGIIERAEFIGQLAPDEKTSDENLRLGFQVNGVLSSNADEDIYRFDAEGGTSVILDIDRTTHSLDTVVELVAADGTVLARSDNSTAEIDDPSLIQTASFIAPGTVNPLRISGFSEPDRFTTNPRDAGVAINLPGAPGVVSPYFVRVSSAGSRGAYQLQVRLDAIDEFAGSTIRNADIRFADTGVAVRGQPIHSPLTGEIAEDSSPNDTQANAQQVGNVLETDRAAMSIAGRLDAFDDVDVYQFDVSYEDVQPGSNTGLVPVTIDVDYADGLGRANTTISVFNATGELLASTRDANIAGDLPRANQGADLQDLSRGSVGGLDPFLGPIELSVGSYFLAISSDALLPRDYEQYVLTNPSNPIARLEPTVGITRIVDEHIDGSQGTPTPPIVPNFLGNQSRVPYFLGDVVLYVSQAADILPAGADDNTELHAINPFTGASFVNLGNIGREVADIDFRNDNTLVALTKDLRDVTFEDAEAGNYISIDETGAAALLGTLIGDDGIETNELDLANPPNAIRSHLFQNQRIGDGIHFEALSVGTFNNAGEVGLGVGNRPCSSIDSITRLCNDEQFYRQPPGISINYNILYQFDPATGEALSSPAADRTGAALATESGTNIVERGFLNTDAAIGSTTSNVKLVVTQQPTLTDPAVVANIVDEAVSFVVDTGPFAPDDTFQLVSGPEIQLQLVPSDVTPQIIQDGWTFSLDGTTYEFDTGGVLVVDRDGRFFQDGETFSLTDLDGAPQTFEFDINNNIQTQGAIGVPFNSALSAVDMANRIVAAINNPLLSGFTFRAELLGTTNLAFNTRISLIDTLAVSESVTDPDALRIEGQAGSLTGNVTIPIEETSVNADFVTSITNVFSGIAAVEASAEGNRVNFPLSNIGDFSDIFAKAAAANLGDPIVDLMHDGMVSIPGAIAVPFGVADETIDVAQRIVDVLNATYVVNPGDPPFAGLDVSGNVQLLLGNSFVSAVDPLETAGDAPGGTITGITIAQDVFGQQDIVFAVSSNGGLYRITNPTTPLGAQAVYIPTSIQLTGIEFAGLTTAPVNVEGGFYQDMLVAIDTAGTLYAFNYAGELQPVFLDGQTSVDTGLTGANGLAFSSLDRNLWAEGTSRAGEPGGGTLTNLHFGPYDFPGGAFGAVESANFSLEGYSFADQPVLYFNYYLETENANSLTQMRDAFNVYINDGTSNWDLLAENNNALVGPQQTFDVGDNGAPDSWRQARIDLSGYAGLDNLQLRFEFHSGANFEFGEPQIGGFDIRALAGADLRDGQTFTIDGIDFELELGPTLLAPTGTNIQDGQLFQVHNLLFEFDKPGAGSTPGFQTGDIAINVTNDLSPDAVALVIEQALALGDYVYRADLSETVGDSNDLEDDAVDTGLTGGGDRFESINGVIGDNMGGSDVDLVRLGLDIGDVLDVQVTSPGPDFLNPVIRIFDQNGIAIGAPVLGNNFTFTAPTTGQYVVGISGVGNETYDITADATTTNGDTGTYDMSLVVNNFNGIIPRTVDNRVQLDGGVKFNPLTSTVEVDGSDGVLPGNVEVAIHADMSRVEVATAIQQAVADTFANGVTQAVKRYDNVVKIIGHSLTDTGPMPGITGSLPGHGTGAGSTVTPTQPNSFPAGELRFRDNAHEGITIDDVIIGFAERGEVATNGLSDPGFFNNPLAVGGVLTGEYQAEIRLGGSTVGTTFDTNYRFEGQAATLLAPGASELIDGQTFIISDGLGSAIFEFEDVNIGDGVALGHTPILFDPSSPGATNIDPDPDYLIAQRILTAINSPSVQALINVTAALGDGTTVVNPFLAPELNSTDNQVNLFADFVDIGAAVPVNLGVDLSIMAELDEPGVGNDTGATATDSGNAGGISATISTALAGGAQGVIGDNPNKIGFDAPLDVDLLEVRLATGDVVSVDVDAAINGSTLDSYIRIFDLTGTELFSNYSGVSPDDETATTDSYLQFTAPVSGIYYVAVSGVSVETDIDGNPVLNMFGNPVIIGNLNYDINNSPSGTADGATTGPYDLTIDILSGGIEVVRFDKQEIGDKNVPRDQGQLIIQNTIVRDSADFGINIGAGPRTGPDGDVPHQGAVRNLRELNSVRLVPGAVVVNNVLSNNGAGGIRFAGDAGAGGQNASVPMGRIVNNTLVGDGGTLTAGGANDTGILIENNASPTVVNNVIVNFATGVDIAADANSQTTVLGSNLVQGNAATLSPTTPSLGEAGISLADSETLFLDMANGIYYLGAGSRAIDSSISALDERSALSTVKGPHGIADSPILAPRVDALGQLRVDDPGAGTPGSTGENLFIDRGAIERADNAGPTAVLIDPRDNDAAGIDTDSTVSIVDISSQEISLSNFTIQLLDGVEPVDPANGVGVNDQAVSADQITVLRDGVALTEGVDYRFSYDALNDVIRLTPTAGLWEANHVYKIIMANGDQFVVTAPDGAGTIDGNTFTITDQDNNVVTFEYDSGYEISVLPTLALQIPEPGGALGGVTDREQFTVTDDMGNMVVFEFDNNGATAGGTTPIVFTPVMTDDEVAQQVVDALISADLNLQPKLIGDGQIHLGASPNHTFDTALAPNIALTGSQTTGGVVDGGTLLVDDGNVRHTYEFDVDGTIVDGNTRFAFNYGLTHTEIAQLISDRLVADTVLTPTNLGAGRLHIGGNNVTVIDTSASLLTQFGTPGVADEFGIQVPSIAGQIDGIVDGMTFQVGDGVSLPVTFEFDDDGQFVLGNTLIIFNQNTTLDQLTNEIASKISSVGIGLSPANVGNGFIELRNDTTLNVFNLGTSSLIQTGTPGVDGNQAIPFIPDASFTAIDMAGAITDAVNASSLNSVATQRADDVLITNVATITGIVDAFVESIRDYAGNVLQSNQSNGGTEFTIIFGEGLDYGDASQLPTLLAVDGARHTVVTGFSLGTDVDVDPDGQPTINADGDDLNSRDDEDGVTQDGIVPGYITTFTVTAQGITPTRPGKLDAWVDFDGDGNLEPGEKIADSMDLVNGPNVFTVNVPTNVTIGDAAARFRFSSTGGLQPHGAAADGEVEDYIFPITPSSWTNPVNNFDVFPDNVVTPFDLLKVLEFVQIVGFADVPKTGPIQVPTQGGTFNFDPPPQSPYYDVNRDGVISTTDLRLVFVQLTEGEGEGEAAEGEGGSAAALAAPLSTFREIPFQLTPSLESLVAGDSSSLLEESLPLDGVLDDMADEVSSTLQSQTSSEVDDFFANLDEI